MANRIALGAGVGLVAAVALAAASPARAQCRLCATPTTAPPAAAQNGAIELSVETALDFDRLVVHGAGQGSATLLPGGERSASGVVTAVSGRAMVGEVRVRGEPGRDLRIELPLQIQLYTIAGGTITIKDIVGDHGDRPRLDSAGFLAFRFGGRLTLSGDSEGEYRGDLPITVEYP